MLYVEVSSDNEKFTIFNIYRHPNRNTSAQFYEDLMRFGDSKVNCILVGDYNAHHSQWGCLNMDHAGRLVLASIENHYACILNNQRPTLLLSSNSGWSVIDLIIAIANIAPLYEVYTEEDTRDSDHYPLRSKLASVWSCINGSPIRLTLILKRLISRTSWPVHTIRLLAIYYLM